MIPRPSMMIDDAGTIHIEWVVDGNTVYMTFRENGVTEAYLEANVTGEWEFSEPPQPDPVKKDPSLGYHRELFNADPDCEHNIVGGSHSDGRGGGDPYAGVHCTKCPGWFCY